MLGIAGLVSALRSVDVDYSLPIDNKRKILFKGGFELLIIDVVTSSGMPSVLKKDEVEDVRRVIAEDKRLVDLYLRMYGTPTTIDKIKIAKWEAIFDKVIIPVLMSERRYEVELKLREGTFTLLNMNCILDAKGEQVRSYFDWEWLWFQS